MLPGRNEKCDPVQGHAIVIAGIGKRYVTYHDSGPASAHANKRVDKTLFARAWKATGTDKDPLLVFGLRGLPHPCAPVSGAQGARKPSPPLAGGITVARDGERAGTPAPARALALGELPLRIAPDWPRPRPWAIGGRTSKIGSYNSHFTRPAAYTKIPDQERRLWPTSAYMGHLRFHVIPAPVGVLLQTRK